MAPKENNIAYTLLSRAHSPDTTTRIHTEKIVQRPLHLKPSTPNTQLQRRLQRQQKQSARKSKSKKQPKPAPLSARQKRALCLYDIPRAAQKYSIYEGLHRLWLGYVREILGAGPVTGTVAAKLCAADFHGAELEVVRSRCVSRVGVKGIVVKDSKFVFEIVTKGDQVKVVPKEHTVFRFTVPQVGKQDEVKEGEKAEEGQNGATAQKGEERRDLVFELHGDQFIFRAVDRANRKFKSHFLPDV